MTPQEIQEKHFHDTFRGYSHEEVDLFLDEVAVAFERLYRENQSFMRRVVDLEEQLKRAQEMATSQPERVAQEAFEEDPGVTESTLKRMLLIAQETADRAVQEARQRAREIQEQARARADEMMEHAERRVRELSSERMDKEKELERAKEALRRFDQQYRASFRVFIESQLEALKDLPAAPAAVDMNIGVPSPAFEDTLEGAGGFESPVHSESAGMETVGMETVAMSVDPVEIESGSWDQVQDAAPRDFGSPSIEPGSVQMDPGPTQWDQGTTESQWAEEGSGSFDSPDDPELVRTSRSGSSSPSSVQPEKEEEQDEGQSTGSSKHRSRADRRAERKAGPADGKDAEEDRLIRELFWGDDD